MKIQKKAIDFFEYFKLISLMQHPCVDTLYIWQLIDYFTCFFFFMFVAQRIDIFSLLLLLQIANAYIYKTIADSYNVLIFIK